MTRDSAGVTIVESRDGAWANGGGVWRIPAEPVLRIGSVADEDTSAQFTRFTGLARLGDGTIVVLEPEAMELRWFDESGRHLRTSRLRGQGPGEVPWVLALNVLAGDTAIVDGGRPAKTLFFAPTGEYVREEILDETPFRSVGRWGECGGLVAPDRSRVVCQELPGATPLPPDPGPGHLRHFLQYVRVSRDLSQVDSMGRYGGIEQFGVDVGQNWTSFVVHPFHSRSHLAVGGEPMLIAIGTNPEYSIELWRPGTGLQRIVRRSGARRAPTAGERDSATATMREWQRRTDPAIVERLIDAVPVPDSLPAIMGLLVSRRGELFVTREGLLPPQSRTIIDVFDAQGRFLGPLTLPPRVRLWDVGDDYLLTSRTDDDGVPFIELYSLQR